MTKDTSTALPVGKVKAAATTAPAKYVPAAKTRVIPGMAPAAANAPVKKPAAAPAPATAKPAAAPAPAPRPAPVAAPAPVAVTAAVTAADKDKRSKALLKKLKAIEEIRTKVAARQTVDPEQLKKLETEAALKAELASL